MADCTITPIYYHPSCNSSLAYNFISHYWAKGTRWSEWEDFTLIEHIAEDFDLHFFIDCLGRTPNSILARVERLMLQGKFPVESDPYQWLKNNKI